MTPSDMVAHYAASLSDIGVTVTAHMDGLRGWKNFILAHGTTAADSLDPDTRPDIRRDNSLWLEARMDGETVGVMAMRVFETASLIGECRSGQLWWTPDRVLIPSFDFVLNPSFPDFSGRLMYQGGLRVIRNGLDIGWRLPRMIRWVGFSRFAVQASVSCMLQSMYERADPIGYNGYHHVAKVLANAEIGDEPQDVWLLVASRAHSIDRAPQEAGQVVCDAGI